MTKTYHIGDIERSGKYAVSKFITCFVIGKSHKLMVLNNATITPNPMVPGKPAKVNIDAELCKQTTKYTCFIVHHYCS